MPQVQTPSRNRRNPSEQPQQLLSVEVGGGGSSACAGQLEAQGAAGTVWDRSTGALYVSPSLPLSYIPNPSPMAPESIAPEEQATGDASECLAVGEFARQTVTPILDMATLNVSSVNSRFVLRGATALLHLSEVAVADQAAVVGPGSRLLHCGYVQQQQQPQPQPQRQADELLGGEFVGALSMSMASMRVSGGAQVCLYGSLAMQGQQLDIVDNSSMHLRNTLPNQWTFPHNWRFTLAMPIVNIMNGSTLSADNG